MDGGKQSEKIKSPVTLAKTGAVFKVMLLGPTNAVLAYMEK